MISNFRTIWVRNLEFHLDRKDFHERKKKHFISFKIVTQIKTGSFFFKNEFSMTLIVFVF